MDREPVQVDLWNVSVRVHSTEIELANLTPERFQGRIHFEFDKCIALLASFIS